MSVYHTGACDEPTPKQEAGAAATPSRQATRSSVLAALFLPFLPAQGVEHNVGGLDAGDEHGTCRRKGVGGWLGWDHEWRCLQGSRQRAGHETTISSSSSSTHRRWAPCGGSRPAGSRQAAEGWHVRQDEERPASCLLRAVSACQAASPHC